jgi:nucleoside-diphosphate-sugar epimerase
MRVYLTGGSGLLGSHLAERLRDRGDEVVCLQRADSDTSFLKGLGCVVVEGNVREGSDALRAGMVGCQALVHAAAHVYVGGPWPRLRAVNVEGTTNVIRAAAAAGVPRVVHVSSVAVYGRRHGPVDEDTSLDSPLPPGALYARSKREAETAARAAAESGRVDLTIVRPAALYGERDRLMSPKLAQLVRLPVVPLMGRGDNGLPVVYAGNAAHAIELILVRQPPERIYNLATDFRLTQKGLLEGLAHALGKRPRFVSVPSAFVRESARLGESLGLNIPGAGDLTLERAARLSLDENPYSTARLVRDLGWKPPFTHDEGLRRTAEWLVDERSR